MKIPSVRVVLRKRRLLAACAAMAVAAISQTARADYAASVLANNPIAFWQLAETGDPSTGTLPAVDSSGNSHNATYGSTSKNAFNGYYGPENYGYAGFANGQGALYTGFGGISDLTSPVTVPPLNISTNVTDTTIVMWVYPAANVPTAAGLLFDRTTDAGSRAGFGFGGLTNSAGYTDLGYNWNDTQATWGWNSPLYVPLNTWSFVALVVQTNKATAYLNYVDSFGVTNILSAANTATHNPVAWNGGTMWLGGDPYNGGGNRVFPGYISGAAIFHAALTSDQITAMFAAGLGVSGFPPSITTQPQDQSVLSGTTVTLSAGGVGGTSPISYQWQVNGTNVNLRPDTANFVGANSNVLTILNATAVDAGSYHVVLNNSVGTTVSSNATVSIMTAALVGHWLTNNTLADTSGFQPAGTHDGYDINNTGSYAFTNDVPPSKTGKSLWLFNGDTGIAISNSSLADANYTNTFDTTIHNSFTVGCFAKGWPGTWNPWVSKWGENGYGWQLRQYGFNGVSPAWTIRGTGDADDMAATGLNLATDTNSWHFYVGTYNANTRVRNLYVDGVLSASETNNGTYTMTPWSHVALGARDNGINGTNAFGNYFTGEIYDVRIYNYALAGSEILNWYGAVAPSIASQPVPTAVFIGSKATFTVTASGTPPLTYQWQLNGVNVNLLSDATNFNGGTSNVLTILNVSSNDIGSYHVTVTSSLGYGTVTSSNAALAIVPKVLLGEWFTNGTMSDLSGYTPPGTHDAYPPAAFNYQFTNDTPPGLSGQSVWFTSTNSCFAIANTANTDGGYTNTFDTSALSIAFWAKDRGPGGPAWEAWVAKDGYNNDGEYNGIGWSFGTEAWSQNTYFDMEGIDNGGIAYTMGDGLWGNGILECNPVNLPGDNTTWHHYAATYNPETGVRRTYFDGKLVAEQTGNAPYAKAPSRHLTIGGQEQATAGFTGFHRGFMYDVRVYNYALSSNEVVALIPDPLILKQPLANLDAYVGVTAQLKATTQALNLPVTNQWQLNGTNLVDGAFGGATISGSHSNVLTIANVTTNIQGVYRLILSNPAGMTISSNATVTVFQTAAAPSANLVGEWVAGATNLTDTSGYSPAGTHDGLPVSGTGVPATGYSFSTDVPSGMTGQSLTLVGNTAIEITNSSDLDGAYTNTYDDIINTNGMTVMCWAKGLPGTWNPWVSKYGENGSGWQLRVNGDSATPCWTIQGAGTVDMSSTLGKSDGNWHHYAGTYDPNTGIRNLYVDGVLAAQLTGQTPFNGSTSSHMAIGARDNGGNSFGNYFNGKIYAVRIYNTALSEAQINNFLVPKVLPAPVFNAPIRNGNQLVLSWSTGTLQESTNIMGPWTPVGGATSPFTNDVSTNGPRMFYRLSNP